MKKMSLIGLAIVLGTCGMVRGLINCPNGLSVSISGDQYAGVGTTIKYTCVGSPAGGTYSWTSSSGLTITAGANTSEATVDASDDASLTKEDQWVKCKYTKSGKDCEDEMKVTVYKITFSVSSWSPTVSEESPALTYLASGTVFVLYAGGDEFFEFSGQVEASVLPNSETVRKNVFPRYRAIVFQNVVAIPDYEVINYPSTGDMVDSTRELPFADPVCDRGNFSTTTCESSVLEGDDTPGTGYKLLWKPIGDYNAADTIQYTHRETVFVIWLAVYSDQTEEITYLKWFKWRSGYDITFNVTGSSNAGPNVLEWNLEEVDSGDGVGEEHVPAEPPLWWLQGKEEEEE